jgi:predicted enzyme related to lactoylglutathione lyase
MFTPKGKFGWYELMTSDIDAAGKFYSDIVGWSTHKMPSNGGMEYTTFNLGEVGIAGMLKLEGHTGWIGYIHVDDVDAHAQRVVEAGGKLWKGPVDVPGMLRFAIMSDPQGAAIAIFTPNPVMPAPTTRPEPPAIGTIGWHELYTSDLEGGFEFYQKLFGWTKLSDMDMGPMGVYRVVDQGDGKPMGDAGMMTKSEEMPVSNWGFYFNVDGIKAAIERVKAGGGKVLRGPHQVPGDLWIMNGQDPQGAHFSLVSVKE